MLSHIKNALQKTLLKRLFAPVLYRHPPIGLQPSELGVYLHELLVRSNVQGEIAEVGCSLGGTAVVASQLVRKYSPDKSYTCFDTFGGFVDEQFEKDRSLGTPADRADFYSSSSIRLVRRILDLHGCQEVRLVQGDISNISDAFLEEKYSVVLMDVDLAIPTYAGLKRFYPRLSQGGIILVDDCRQDPEQGWRAFLGYQQFCLEEGIEARVQYGFGILEKY